MAYGLRIWDASGALKLDVTDLVSRMRYVTEAAADTDGSVDLPDIDGLDSVEVSVLIAEDFSKCPHLASRSGTTISWTAQSGSLVESGDSLIFSFLYT